MKLKIGIEGKQYEVDVEVAEPENPILGVGGYMPMPQPVRVPAAMPAPAPNKSPDSGPVNEEKVCRSPITGIVVRVLAQTGQAIQVGDPLIVLEAMKMETNITAPVAAKVARINVSSGDGVQGGQVLVEFE